MQRIRMGTRGPDRGPRKPARYKAVIAANKKIAALQKAIESIEGIIRDLREKKLIEPLENQDGD
jgi:hypothetical protein